MGLSRSSLAAEVCTETNDDKRIKKGFVASPGREDHNIKVNRKIWVEMTRKRISRKSECLGYA